MKEFKPMKELIRALYEIVKAIKNKNNNTDENDENNKTVSNWQDFINISLLGSKDIPVGIVKGDLSDIYFFKDISIEETSLPDGGGYVVYDHQLNQNDYYYNDGDSKPSILGLIYSNETDYDNAREITFGNGWWDERTIEKDGKTYYFYYNEG